MSRDEVVTVDEGLKVTDAVTIEVMQAPPPEEPEPSFWAVAWGHIKKAGSAVWWVVKRYLLGPLPAILLVAGAILLVIFGVKNLQIGGLLGKLLGRKDGEKAIDVANSVPKDRVREDGTVIKPGEPDKEGMTQATVVEIEKPGLFSNPDTVKIKPPGEAKPIVVDLPTGVKAKDVDKVVIVKPKVYAVSVKDNSGVDAKTVDDLLAKYGD